MFIDEVQRSNGVVCDMNTNRHARWQKPLRLVIALPHSIRLPLFSLASRTLNAETTHAE